MNVLPWLRGLMRGWIVLLAAILTALPVLAQYQAETPNFGGPDLMTRHTSSDTSLAAAADSGNWVNRDLLTKVPLFVIFNVCVGLIIGIFKGRLRMAFLLSLLLGPIGWIAIVFFVKSPPEREDPGVL